MSAIEVLREASQRWNATPLDQRPGYAPPGSFHKEFAAFFKQQYARLKKEGFASDMADGQLRFRVCQKEIGRLWTQAKMEGKTSRPPGRQTKFDQFKREQFPLVEKQYPDLGPISLINILARRWRGLGDFDSQSSPKKGPISEAQQKFATYNQFRSSQEAAVREMYPELHHEVRGRIIARRWRGLSDFEDSSNSTSN